MCKHFHNCWWVWEPTCGGMFISVTFSCLPNISKKKIYIFCKENPECCAVCLVAQSCLTLCDPMDCSPPGSSVHEASPSKNTGLGCHALLQGIFLTQRSNPGLLDCRWILYHLSHQGRNIFWKENPKHNPVYLWKMAVMHSGQFVVTHIIDLL